MLEEPSLDPEAPPSLGAVSIEAVATFLGNLGDVANMLLPTPEGVPDLWRFTDAEIASLAPALTRVANRRAPAAAAVLTEHSDEAAVAIGLARYAMRNLATLRGAKAPEAQGFDEVPAGVDVGAGLLPEGAEGFPDDAQRPYFETPGFQPG
jgi:hypothetical protein